jgi:hypothetical protein
MEPMYARILEGPDGPLAVDELPDGRLRYTWDLPYHDPRGDLLEALIDRASIELRIDGRFVGGARPLTQDELDQVNEQLGGDEIDLDDG